MFKKKTKQYSKRQGKESFMVSFISNPIIASRFWFITAILLFVLNLVQPLLIVASSAGEEKVLILDKAGNFVLTHLMSYDEAQELHEYMAVQSAQALLSINPLGYDYPELLSKLCLEEAHNKAEKLHGIVKEEIVSKNITQKPHVFKTKLVRAVIDGYDSIIAEVNGEVIRACSIGNNSYIEKVPFKLQLHLLRNPNIITNQRFPLAIYDFEIQYEGA